MTLEKKVIRVDEKIHKLVGKIPRGRHETDGDVVGRIILEYAERNKING